jgi:hypothetical protein
MNRRVLLGGLLAVVCLATLWGVWGQRSQLAGLRAEQQQLLAQLAARADASASLGAAESARASSGAAQPALVATPELLRLRNEVTLLTQRRRELAGARAENERLRAQLASRGTNGPGGLQLPPGYVRRSEARLVGYNSPDDTLQSLLWAIRNHDLTNVLQAFTPERAEHLRALASESHSSTDDFFSQSADFVGARIVRRGQPDSDGSTVVQVEVVPGIQGLPITFRQINGQWKISGPF